MQHRGDLAAQVFDDKPVDMAAAVAVIHPSEQLAVGPDTFDIGQADMPSDPRHGQLDLWVVPEVGKIVPDQEVAARPKQTLGSAVEAAVQLWEWGPGALDDATFVPADRVGVDAQLSVSMLGGKLLEPVDNVLKRPAAEVPFPLEWRLVWGMVSVHGRLVVSDPMTALKTFAPDCLMSA
jgi:hypothetical protein